VRKYHPDLSKGSDKGERFQRIVAAYRILGNSTKKRLYDEMKVKKAATGGQEPERERTYIFAKLLKRGFKIFRRFSLWHLNKQKSFSLRFLSVHLSFTEALTGCFKSFDNKGEDGKKNRLNVRIPPGSYSGRILKAKGHLLLLHVSKPSKDVSLTKRGIEVELPLSISEAILGTKLLVPTCRGMERLSVPPITQSGAEFILQNSGAPTSSGLRGAMIFRASIKIPPKISLSLVREKLNAFDEGYVSDLRSEVNNTLSQLL
jgi:DnaJ-class molecular chaperone